MAADRCIPLLTPYCYVKVCQAWGGTAFSEVLCRTKGDGVPSVPAETLSLLSPGGWPLPSAPDGGPTTAPSTCLPYSLPAPAPDASVTAAGGAGGQGGILATGDTGGQGGVTSAPAGGDTGGQSGVFPTGDTGGQIAVASTPAAGGTGGQGGVISAPAGGDTGGQSGVLAAAGTSLTATSGAGGTGGSDIKPSDSSGCAVGGWLSAKALGPWLLAGLFGVIVTLARRRRR